MESSASSVNLFLGPLLLESSASSDTLFISGVEDSEIETLHLVGNCSGSP